MTTPRHGLFNFTDVIPNTRKARVRNLLFAAALSPKPKVRCPKLEVRSLSYLPIH